MSKPQPRTIYSYQEGGFVPLIPDLNDLVSGPDDPATIWALPPLEFPGLEEAHEELAKKVAFLLDSDPEAITRLLDGGLTREEIDALNMAGKETITVEESMEAIVHALQARFDSAMGLSNIGTGSGRLPT